MKQIPGLLLMAKYWLKPPAPTPVVEQVKEEIEHRDAIHDSNTNGLNHVNTSLHRHLLDLNRTMEELKKDGRSTDTTNA